jgi:hypothetical protein
MTAKELSIFTRLTAAGCTLIGIINEVAAGYSFGRIFWAMIVIMASIAMILGASNNSRRQTAKNKPGRLGQSRCQTSDHPVMIKNSIQFTIAHLICLLLASCGSGDLNRAFRIAGIYRENAGIRYHIVMSYFRSADGCIEPGGVAIHKLNHSSEDQDLSLGYTADGYCRILWTDRGKEKVIAGDTGGKVFFVENGMATPFQPKPNWTADEFIRLGEEKFMENLFSRAWSLPPGNSSGKDH